ncbi:hypothetical protein ONS96_009617 [Cadophora gregata f. sp. sojae]|nr:hypothetical protein ONS96_009617 [Cadophora gregata f. sp. sojae]
MAFFDINKLTDALFAPHGSATRSWLPICQGADGWNNETLRDILIELHNLSLLQSLNIDSSEASFTIHPLIQDWLKARLGTQRAKQYLNESMLILSKYVVSYSSRRQWVNLNLQTKQLMFAHVDASIATTQEFHDSWNFVQGTDLLDSASAYYKILGRQGHYQRAEELCKVVLPRTTNQFREEHPKSVTLMYELATYLLNRGKYDEAEPLLRKCVAADIKNHGKEDIATLGSMNSLADLLVCQNRYKEADGILEEVMEVSMRVLGRDHDQTIRIIINKARILRKLGKHSDAEPILKENLEISIRALGIKHQTTLKVMNNLARCLEKMGELGEAETIFREVLSSEEEDHGPDHPRILKSIHDLAFNLCGQRKLIESEELFRRAYTLYESIVGWQHPQSIKFLGWMADCLQDLGKHEEARRIRSLRKESKTAREKRLLEEKISQTAIGH